MKNIIIVLLVITAGLQINAQNVAVSTVTNDWWPQLGQSANLPTLDGWYYRSNIGSQRLAFDGNVVPGTSIATTFGSIGAPYTGMTIKFDMSMPGPGSNKSTIIVLGSNAQWGGQGIVIEYTEFGVRAVKNFDYSSITWMGFGVDYTAVLGAGGLIAGNEINISSSGLITLKFGTYVCPVSYQADLNVLANSFVLVCPNASGFKFKNCIVTKGGNSVSYFPQQITTAQQNIQLNNFVVSPSSDAGLFNLINATVGQQFKVYSLNGILLKSGIINSSNQQLDLTELSSGLYIIKTIINNKLVSQKIEKR